MPEYTPDLYEVEKDVGIRADTGAKKLKKLSKKHKDMIALHLDGHKTGDIARVLGVAYGTVQRVLNDDLSQSAAGWPLISRFAREHKLLISGGAAFQVQAGAVFSYVPDYVQAGKLAAISADKILRGVPAGTIPVATSAWEMR